MPLDSSLLPLTWMLTCTALVLLMQARFTCLETGLVRAENSINVAIKNVVDFCIASIIFWAFGFGLMFGATAWGLFGTSQFLFDGGSNIQMWTFFLFQLTKTNVEAPPFGRGGNVQEAAAVGPDCERTCARCLSE